ncbi:LacI family DNA-binding transcriptional regulator [Poriferisphaera sp. WC338]|uniref:LacI family DNA-binding transcriptional regulator n=1 Tax=Poriferisphaera sp. WC338 TaxID=3425129 RepID=UPI003D8127AF
MSIVEIAKQAGVSTATVSRVINRHANVSPENVAKVEQAMEEIGYKAAPKVAVGRRSEMDCVAVLVVASHMFDRYSSVAYDAVRSAVEALNERQLGAALSYVTDAEQVPDFVFRNRVRGALVIGKNPKPELEDRLKALPVVWLASHHSSQGDVVLSGNDAVGELAAEYLINRGHKCVGTLNVLADVASEARLRYFRFIAQEAGLTVKQYIKEKASSKVWEHDIDMAWFDAEVEKQIDRLMVEQERPTGLFVTSDFQAAVVHRALLKRGVKLGEEMEIIGSDTEKAALLGLNPRPATIDLGYKSIGRMAVEHLLSLISKGDREPVKIMLSPKLVLGDPVREDWS